MPTIQKLKHNLTQSEKWGTAFKEEIKKLMEEITQKKGEMATMRKESNHLREGIQKGESELKALLDEKLRNAYKKDKLQIKVEEIQARVKVYEQGVRKRTDWNKQLRRKLKTLEKAIQGQQNTASIDEIFDNFSESSILVDSFCSSKKQSRVSAKSQSGYSMIQSSLVRINKLEEDYLGLTSMCKRRQDQMERLKKTESRLREKLKLYSSDKQNVQASSNKPTSQENLLQVQELQAKNRDLSKKIEAQRTWITLYVKHLEQLLLCEQTGEQIRNTILLLQREGKKQLKATTSICSYILRDRTYN